MSVAYLGNRRKPGAPKGENNATNPVLEYGVADGGRPFVTGVAQAAPQVTISHEITTEDLNTAELAAFDQVANSNPRMSHELAANPHLANSGSFLTRWPDLNNFFAKYPGSRERFLEDPGNYLADVNMHRK